MCPVSVVDAGVDYFTFRVVESRRIGKNGY
jgi:hypothetical protein